MKRLLREGSSHWFEIHRNGWKYLEDFRLASLDRFWPQEKPESKCIKDELRMYINYIIKLFHKSQYLNSPYAYFFLCQACCKTVTGKFKVGFISSYAE